MKFFKTYKQQYKLACQVMGAMAEEIIKLREENELLREENKELEAESNRNADLADAHYKRAAELREKIQTAIQMLSKK